MGPLTIVQAWERETFLRLLTEPAPMVEPSFCDFCRADNPNPAAVLYLDEFYCIQHAEALLVLDQGRHGLLALPALAFSGADRG
jgi:hypothetical protein